MTNIKLFGFPDDRMPKALSFRVLSPSDAASETGKSEAQLKKLLEEGKILHTPPNQEPSGYIFWTYKDDQGKIRLALQVAE